MWCRGLVRRGWKWRRQRGKKKKKYVRGYIIDRCVCCSIITTALRFDVCGYFHFFSEHGGSRAGQRPSAGREERNTVCEVATAARVKLPREVTPRFHQVAMDRKPRIINHRTRIAIMNLLLLCTGEYPPRTSILLTNADGYD